MLYATYIFFRCFTKGKAKVKLGWNRHTKSVGVFLMLHNNTVNAKVTYLTDCVPTIMLQRVVGPH